MLLTTELSVRLLWTRQWTLELYKNWNSSLLAKQHPTLRKERQNNLNNKTCTHLKKTVQPTVETRRLLNILWTMDKFQWHAGVTNWFWSEGRFRGSHSMTFGGARKPFVIATELWRIKRRERVNVPRQKSCANERRSLVSAWSLDPMTRKTFHMTCSYQLLPHTHQEHALHCQDMASPKLRNQSDESCETNESIIEVISRIALSRSMRNWKAHISVWSVLLICSAISKIS